MLYMGGADVLGVEIHDSMASEPMPTLDVTAEALLPLCMMLREDARLKTFAKAISGTVFENELCDVSRTFTVFAPEDAAFSFLPSELIESLLTVEMKVFRNFSVGSILVLDLF